MLAEILSPKNILVMSSILFTVLLVFGSEDPQGASAEPSGAITGLATLPTSVPDCGDSVCGYPETQLSCPQDCTTSAGISLLAAEGEEVDVRVEFWDSRYQKDGKVNIELTIKPEGIKWTPSNGCFLGGQDIGPEPRGSVIGWPKSTVSENGHFLVQTTCKLPREVGSGQHTLEAKTDIIF